MKGNDTRRRLQLQIIFAFMTAFAGVLFFTRPEPTTGQIIFRLSVAALGLLGFGIVSRRT